LKVRDIIQQAVHQQLPDAEQIREMYKQRIAEKQKRRRFCSHSLIAVAATVVLVFSVVFGSTLLNLNVENSFMLSAYAMEMRDDGFVEMREVDLIDQTHMWGAYVYDRNLYLNIRLQCRGENLKSVQFSAGDGFFARQYIKTKNGKIVSDDVPILYVGESKTVALYGTDFEILGDSVVLNSDTITDDMLLFLGTAYYDGLSQDSITVHAVATFNDGKQQEETLIIDFERPGVIMEGTLSDDEVWGEPDVGDAPLDPFEPFEQNPPAEQREHPIFGENSPE
jgi:hypothetical protein